MPFKANKLPGKWVRKAVQGRIKCVNCCGNYTANWCGCARAKGEERHKKERWKNDLIFFNYITIFEMLTRSAVAIDCNKFFRWTQFSVNLSKIIVIQMWLFTLINWITLLEREQFATDDATYTCCCFFGSFDSQVDSMISAVKIVFTEGIYLPSWFL